MPTSWPTTLPLPTVEGYGIRSGEAILRTEMEAGPARQRRRFTRQFEAKLVGENQRARTGKRCGFGKARETALRTGRRLTTVPMFILVPQVTVRKRLDVAAAADKWIAELPRLVVRNWREPVR